MWQDQVHGCWTNGVGQVSMSRRVPCVWFKTLLSPFKIINTFWVRDLSFSLGPSKNMDDPAHQGYSQHPWGSHPKVSTPQPVFDSFPPPFCPHWPVSPFLTPHLHWLHHLPCSGLSLWLRKVLFQSHSILAHHSLPHCHPAQNWTLLWALLPANLLCAHHTLLCSWA